MSMSIFEVQRLKCDQCAEQCSKRNALNVRQIQSICISVSRKLSWNEFDVVCPATAKVWRPNVVRCVNNVTRGNPYKLSVNNCRINVRQHYFAERVVSVWNSLSPSVSGTVPSVKAEGQQFERLLWRCQALSGQIRCWKRLEFHDWRI